MGSVLIAGVVMIRTSSPGEKVGQGTSAYRPDIDGLRAIAVLSVVLHHARVPAFSGGYVGVDIFFVISGYLISRIIFSELDQGVFKFARFYERRARRILPALFVVLLVTFIFGAIFYLPSSFAGLSASIVSTLAFVSNIYFWRSTNDYFAATPQETPLLHTWSLGVEEQFYLVMPVVALVATLWFARHRGSAIFLLSAASLAFAVYAVDRMPAFAFYMLPSRLWELGLGSLAALRMGRGVQLPGLAVLAISIAAASAMIAPIFLYTPETPFPGLAALPVCLGTLGLIIVGENRQTVIHKLIANPVSVKVGLASYSIYLWHWPLLCGATFLTAAYNHATLAYELIAAGISIIAGFLSLQFIERPFRERSRVASRTVWIGTIVTSAIFVISAAGVMALSGIPDRFRPSLQALLVTAQLGDLPDCEVPEGTVYNRCRLGVAGQTPSFALVGDSHAMAAAWGVGRAAADENLAGYVFHAGGCPPLLPVETDTTCGRQREFVFRSLLEDKSISVVLLAGLWSLYYNRDEKNYLGNPRPIVGFTEDHFAELYRKTVRTLVAAGKRVVVLEDVPTLPFYLPNALILRDRLGQTVPLGPTLEEYRAMNKRPNAMLRSGKNLGAEVLPTGEFLCSPVCPTSDGRALFYADTNHVSRMGSEILLTEYLRRNVFAREVAH
ncbi:MAG: acyltransferase family protein [Hyphomonadaceae bacterium]